MPVPGDSGLHGVPALGRVYQKLEDRPMAELLAKQQVSLKMHVPSEQHVPKRQPYLARARPAA
jgi:hypothetical protein